MIFLLIPILFIENYKRPIMLSDFLTLIIYLVVQTYHKLESTNEAEYMTEDEIKEITDVIGPIKLSNKKLLLALIIAFIIYIVSAAILMMALHFGGFITITMDNIFQYANYIGIGYFIAIFLGLIISLIPLKFPGTVSFILKIHRFFKRKPGYYFISPSKVECDLEQIVRRSLYGSILITGIGLTLMDPEFVMASTTEQQIMTLGYYIVQATGLLFPFIMLLFYNAPWVLKDAGLFHLDYHDRSLSNVGDDIEDLLEFFAGIDIALAIIEFYFNTNLIDTVLLLTLSLGALLAIVMVFTTMFFIIRQKLVYRIVKHLKSKDIDDVIHNEDRVQRELYKIIKMELHSESAPLETTENTEENVSENIDEKASTTMTDIENKE